MLKTRGLNFLVRYRESLIIMNQCYYSIGVPILWGKKGNKVLSMRKIAVTSEGPSLEDQVDPRFGRAAGFVVVDLETMDTQYIDNGQSQVMAQGAGIQAAELVARAGVSCLLTGYVGPKAFQALSAAGIKVGQNLEGLTVRDAVERFKIDQVKITQASERAGR
jgi:predicted Fe-Mo cluster-binding NifX family protein